MGMLLKTIASDGHEFDTYIAQPNGTALGGLVLSKRFLDLTTISKALQIDMPVRGIW